MRVLFWSLTFWPSIGGIEVLAAKLLPCLRQRGHEFTVVAPKVYADWPDKGQYRGIPIHWLPFQHSLNTGIDHVVEMRQKVLKLKRIFAPDLIHINGIGLIDFYHLTTSQSDATPVLVTLHGDWIQRIDWIAKQILSAADWVAGCSAAILERGQKLTPEIRDRCSVIYNALERPASEPRSLPWDPPRILYLGRLSPEKGIDVAIEAFRLIVDRFPSARLTIAGDGPMRSDLEQQAIRLGISHTIDFIGWVVPEMVSSLLNNHTIVLMPSREDSFPLVALEAALMARPVVATHVGGLPELVIHQQTGLLVQSEDAQAMVEAVAVLLSSPEIAIRYGQAGRRRVQEVFNWKQHVDGYDALYRKLLSGKASGRAFVHEEA
jgi:glycogen(starch) synthase